MLADVRLNIEALCTHPFTESSERSDCIDRRLVTLLSLQAAHLRDECLRSPNLHAVDNVSNLHSRASVYRKHQWVRFTMRRVMYMIRISASVNSPE
jgi:hypothetical protein